MKGLFFKDTYNKGYEILSEVLCVRNQNGYDDLVVVTKRLDDNFVNIQEVSSIHTVESTSANIGY